MTDIPAGRQRYLDWPEREAMRLKVVEEQKTALREAGERRSSEPSTRDEPERGYPNPRVRRSRGEAS